MLLACLCGTSHCASSYLPSDILPAASRMEHCSLLHVVASLYYSRPLVRGAEYALEVPPVVGDGFSASFRCWVYRDVQGRLHPSTSIEAYGSSDGLMGSSSSNGLRLPACSENWWALSVLAQDSG